MSNNNILNSNSFVGGATHQQPMNSIALDKSLALESLLGHPNPTQTQATQNNNPSVFLSMELAR